MNPSLRPAAPILAGILLVAAGCAVEPNGAPDDEAVGTAREAQVVTIHPTGYASVYYNGSTPPYRSETTLGAGTFRAAAGDFKLEPVQPKEMIYLGAATRLRYCTADETTCGNATAIDEMYVTPPTANAAVLEVRPTVVVYRDSDYGGVSEVLEVGRYEVGLGDLKGVGNDAISSIRVGAGLTARLCADDPDTTVGSTCVTLKESSTQLPSSIDNRTSWIDVRPATALHRDQGFQGFRGVYQVIGAGRFPASALAEVGNDTVSAAVVPEGVTSRLCSDDPTTTVGYRCQTLTKSAWRLSAELDNTTSWVESRHTVILSPHRGIGDTETGDLTELRGYAASPNGGEITGTKLEWSSSVDGFLGTGNKLTVRLSKSMVCSGRVKHVISLTATDAVGVRSTTSRVVYAVGPCKQPLP